MIVKAHMLPASLTSEELDERDRLAREVDAQIAEVVRRRRKDKITLAYLLHRVHRERLYRTFGKESVVIGGSESAMPFYNTPLFELSGATRWRDRARVREPRLPLRRSRRTSASTSFTRSLPCRGGNRDRGRAAHGWRR